MFAFNFFKLLTLHTVPLFFQKLCHGGSYTATTKSVSIEEKRSF